MFFTASHGSPRYRAMLAHQEMFGKFASASRSVGESIGLWENWGLDNGAFTGFDQKAFMDRLKEFLPYKATCRFVVVPDVPFCWGPTLVKFKDWSPSIRRMGFPVGLAVQDGATVQNVPWDELDALFIGGSTEWKRDRGYSDLPMFEQTAYLPEVAGLVREAKRRGLWVHLGRSANAPGQLWYAYRLGVDSVDGTGERFQPDVKFQWIAQTMWEIHQDAQRTDTGLLSTEGASVARTEQK